MSRAADPSHDVSLVVIAKAPVPGRSKTRLCPPCTPAQAAALAEAAIVDTLEAVRATPGVIRRVLALDGGTGPWLVPGFEVVGQRGHGLDERLAAVFEDVGGPAVVVGMDTPQISPPLLSTAVRALGRRGVDAVLGRAFDGGYWAIGLREPDPAVFLGVPMSSARTAERQRARLDALRLRVVELPQLRDVDRIEDAWAVAAQTPASRFARALREVVEPTWAPA